MDLTQTAEAGQTCNQPTLKRVALRTIRHTTVVLTFCRLPTRPNGRRLDDVCSRTVLPLQTVSIHLIVSAFRIGRRRKEFRRLGMSLKSGQLTKTIVET